MNLLLLVARPMLNQTAMGLFYRNQPFIFGETTYTNGGMFGPVKGCSLNVMVLLEGSMEVCWDGTTTTITAGRAALFYTLDSIEFRFPAGVRTRVQWCETGDPAGSELVRQKLRKAPLTIELSDVIRQMMEIGLRLSDESQDEVRAFRDAQGEAMICAYLHKANLDRDEAVVPEAFSRGKEFIERHFCEPLGNEQIARGVKVTPQYLLRVFRRNCGVSPIQHLWNVRAEKGAFLLRQTGLSVSEIAYQCGYKNPFHFSRHVKAKYGHSPSDLRNLRRTLQPSLLRGNYPDQHFEDPALSPSSVEGQGDERLAVGSHR